MNSALGWIVPLHLLGSFCFHTQTDGTWPPVGTEESTAACIACIYKVEFTYKWTKQCLMWMFMPWLGHKCSGQLSELPWGTMNPSFLLKALARMRASCAELSQSASTYVNFRSKSTVAITFCVGLCFLPLKAYCMCLGTLTNTWMPSMAPTQS